MYHACHYHPSCPPPAATKRQKIRLKNERGGGRYGSRNVRASNNPLALGSWNGRESRSVRELPMSATVRTTIRLIKIDEFVLRELFFKNQTDRRRQSGSLAVASQVGSRMMLQDYYWRTVQYDTR